MLTSTCAIHPLEGNLMNALKLKNPSGYTGDVAGTLSLFSWRFCSCSGASSARCWEGPGVGMYPYFSPLLKPD